MARLRKRIYEKMLNRLFSPDIRINEAKLVDINLTMQIRDLLFEFCFINSRYNQSNVSFTLERSRIGSFLSFQGWAKLRKSEIYCLRLVLSVHTSSKSNWILLWKDPDSTYVSRGWAKSRKSKILCLSFGF